VWINNSLDKKLKMGPVLNYQIHQPARKTRKPTSENKKEKLGIATRQVSTGIWTAKD
jgi:hypothetical protein